MRNKLGQFIKGNVSWHQGRIGAYSKSSIQSMRNSHLGKKHSDEEKKKISESLKNAYANGIRNTIPPSQKGVKRSLETCEKIGKSKRGELSSTWKGGITPILKKIRGSMQARQWRNSVFERDNYTCQECGAKSGQGYTVVLNADHIQPFAFFPELRFDLSNGRTLCVPCHRKTPTFAGRSRQKITTINL